MRIDLIISIVPCVAVLVAFVSDAIRDRRRGMQMNNCLPCVLDRKV